jgi:hypothetical protein
MGQGLKVSIYLGKEYRTPVSHNRTRSPKSPDIFTPNISRSHRRHPLCRLMHILFVLRPLALSARFLWLDRALSFDLRSKESLFPTPLSVVPGLKTLAGAGALIPVA